MRENGPFSKPLSQRAPVAKGSQTQRRKRERRRFWHRRYGRPGKAVSQIINLAGYRKVAASHFRVVTKEREARNSLHG
jgi:hypothetical protein